jgi:DNA transformation protein
LGECKEERLPPPVSASRIVEPKKSASPVTRSLAFFFSGLPRLTPSAFLPVKSCPILLASASAAHFPEGIVFSQRRNLGPASSSMLLAAGIRSEQQLRELGVVAAYLTVKASGTKPSLNLLWAIAGALTDRDWKEVSRVERTALLMQMDDAERQEYGKERRRG